jgi:hypothetical protein
MQRQVKVKVKRRRRTHGDAPAEELPAASAANTTDAEELLARIDELLSR